MPLLDDPTVTHCRTCFVILRDLRPRPGARWRLLLDECAACRVERQRPEDTFGPAAQDEAEPCEVATCAEARRKEPRW